MLPRAEFDFSSSYETSETFLQFVTLRIVGYQTINGTPSNHMVSQSRSTLNYVLRVRSCTLSRENFISYFFRKNRQTLTINSRTHVFQCASSFFLFECREDTFDREKSVGDVTFSSTGLILDQRVPRHCSYRDLAVEMTNRSSDEHR